MAAGIARGREIDADRTARTQGARSPAGEGGGPHARARVRVGIVGATGQVGTLMRRLLAERGFPLSQLRLFASSRSAGIYLRQPGPHGEYAIVVEDAETADYHGLDVVLMSAGKQLSRRLAPRIAAAGALVVDNSSAWRGHPRVPLVIADVNDAQAAACPEGIIANPNCVTIAAVMALAPLHRLAGLRAVTASSYQAISGAGTAAVAEFARQITAVVGEGGSPDRDALVYGHGKLAGAGEPLLAFNVLPDIGAAVGDGQFAERDEERKLRDESRKILGVPDLRVSATCVRVPVFTGHCVALNARFARPVSPEQAVEALAHAPGVRLCETPTAALAAGEDAVLVGRIRPDETAENALALFCAGDNLRKGAALNAVQIAELVGCRRTGA